MGQANEAIADSSLWTAQSNLQNLELSSSSTHWHCTLMYVLCSVCSSRQNPPRGTIKSTSTIWEQKTCRFLECQQLRPFPVLNSSWICDYGLQGSELALCAFAWLDCWLHSVAAADCGVPSQHWTSILDPILEVLKYPSPTTRRRRQGGIGSAKTVPWADWPTDTTATGQGDRSMMVVCDWFAWNAVVAETERKANTGTMVGRDITWTKSDSPPAHILCMFVPLCLFFSSQASYIPTLPRVNNPTPLWLKKKRKIKKIGREEEKKKKKLEAELITAQPTQYEFPQKDRREGCKSEYNTTYQPGQVSFKSLGRLRENNWGCHSLVRSLLEITNYRYSVQVWPVNN